MIIKYKCNRCKKTVDVRLGGHKFNYKEGNKERWGLPDVHYRLDCTVCNRLIRYISKDDLLNLGVDLEKVPVTHKGRRKKIKSKVQKKPARFTEPNTVSLGELNFKLDLILEHLEIQQRFRVV